jgi:hypothetical protein
MTLITGTPVGAITTQEGIFIEGAAYLYFQDAQAPLANTPDADGFYWGLGTTGTYGVYSMGCYQDLALGSNYTVNSVRCDTVGDKDALQKLNHLELSLTITSLFPLSTMTPFMRGGVVTHNAGTHTEKMGIGPVNNNQFWHIYLAKVYDEAVGDYVSFTLHRAKFVDAWSIAMKSGSEWAMSGVKIWAFADDTKPSAQQFATVIRCDASAL